MDAEHQNAMYRPDFVRRVLERRRADAERERQQGEAEHQQDLATKAAEERSVRLGKLKAKVISTDGERVLVKKVIAYAGALHDVDPKLITAPANGKRRQSIIIERARIDAILLVRELRPDMSANQIGRLFNRDHSTVLNILWKYAKVERYQSSGPRPEGVSKCG